MSRRRGRSIRAALLVGVYTVSLTGLAGGLAAPPASAAGLGLITQLGFSVSTHANLAADAAGDIFVPDESNNRILELAAVSGTQFGIAMTAGGIYTIAGTGSSDRGFSGDGGPATQAQLSSPEGAAVDASGDLFIADLGNNRIRKVSPAGVITTVAGDGTQGYTGDGGPATSAALNLPKGIAVDPAGDLFIADTYNNVVREVPAASGTQFGIAMTAGDIYTIAGGGSSASDGVAATSASLGQPTSVAVDAAGDVFINDFLNNRVREVPAASGTQFGIAMTAGDIYTIAGTGQAGSGGDGGKATAAGLHQPMGVAVDTAGDVYVADTVNGVVRMVTPAGIIRTVAGGGQYTPNNVPATWAYLTDPAGIAIDGSGDLILADSGGGVYRVAHAATTSVNAVSFATGFAVGGAPASWTVGFTTSASGLLYAGLDTITLTAPTGTVFPLAASDYVMSGTPVTATPTQTAPNNVTLVVPATIDAATAATVSIAGVTNPPIGSDPGSAFSVATSMDSTPASPASGLDFTAGSPDVTSVTVSTPMPVAGSLATWTVAFVNGSGSSPAGGDTVTISDDLGAQFSTAAADYTVSAGAESYIPATVAAASPGTVALSLAPGDSLPPNTLVTVLMRNVTNPALPSSAGANPASDAVTVATAANAAGQGSIAIEPTGVALAIVPDVQGVATATWTATFDVPQTVPWTAGYPLVLTESLDGSTFSQAGQHGAAFPTDPHDYTIRENGTSLGSPPSVTFPSAGEVWLTLPSTATAPAAGQSTAVPFTVEVRGVGNPNFPHTDALSMTMGNPAWQGYATTAAQAFEAVSGLFSFAPAMAVGAPAASSAGASGTLAISFTPATPVPGGGSLTLADQLGAGWSSQAADYTLAVAGGTPAPYHPAAAAVSANGRVTLTLPAGEGLAAGEPVTVTAGNVAAVATTVGASQESVTVETSSGDAGTSPAADIVPGAVVASPSSSVAGAQGTTWTVGFTQDGATLPGGGAITLADRLGALFASVTSDYSIQVGGGTAFAPAQAAATGHQVTLTLPAQANIPAGANVTVLAQAVTNPTAAHAQDALIVATQDSLPAPSSPFAFAASGGQYAFAPVFSPYSLTAGAQSGWLVSFTTVAALAGGADTVTITAPAGTQFPTSASAYAITGGLPLGVPPAVNGGGSSVTLTVPASLSADETVTVTIAGVGNPPAATYPGSAFSVATSGAATPAYATTGLVFAASAGAAPALAPYTLQATSGSAPLVSASASGPCLTPPLGQGATPATEWNGPYDLPVDGTDLYPLALQSTAAGQSSNQQYVAYSGDAATCSIGVNAEVGSLPTTPVPSSNLDLPVSCSFNAVQAAAPIDADRTFLFALPLGQLGGMTNPLPGAVGSAGGSPSGQPDQNAIDVVAAYAGDAVHCTYQVQIQDASNPSQWDSIGSPLQLTATAANPNPAQDLQFTAPDVVGLYRVQYDVWEDQGGSGIPLGCQANWLVPYYSELTLSNGTFIDGQPVSTFDPNVSQPLCGPVTAPFVSNALSNNPGGQGQQQIQPPNYWYLVCSDSGMNVVYLDPISDASSSVGCIYGTPEGSPQTMQNGLNNMNDVSPQPVAGTSATLYNSDNTAGVPPPLDFAQEAAGTPEAGLRAEVREVGTTAPFTLTVEPTALVQLDAMPYKILYMPPGDASQASFSLSQGQSTSLQVSVGNGLTTTQAASTTQSVDNALTTCSGGILNCEDLNTSQTSSWDQATQQLSATTQTGSRGFTVSDTFTQSWTTPQNLSALDDPSNPPWHYDQFALIIHPQMAVWDMGGKWLYNMYAADATEYDVSAAQLLACAQGAPLGIPNASPPVTLAPSECASLLNLDPFAAAATQAVDPAQSLGGLAVRVQSWAGGTPGVGTNGSKAISVSQQQATFASTQQTSSFTSLVTSIVGNAATSATNSATLTSQLSNLAIDGASVASQLAGAGTALGSAAAGLVMTQLEQGQTLSTATTTANGTTTTNSVGLQVNYGQSQTSNSTISQAATAVLASHSQPVESTVWMDGRWDTFMFQVPLPTVSSVSPPGGAVTGGTAVSVSGSGFLSGPVRVEFCTLDGTACTAATSVTVFGDSQLTAVAPALSPGTFDVRVQGSAGLSEPVAGDRFTYAGSVQAAAPTVTSVSPTSGPAAGGAAIALTGSGFSNVQQVWFGSSVPADNPALAAASPPQAARATSFTVVSDQEILACLPASPGAQTVYVSVYGSTGWSSVIPADQLTYTSGGAAGSGCAPAAAAPPVVSSVSPGVGSALGGTAITITGTGFQDSEQSVSCSVYGCAPGSTETLFLPPSVQFCATGGSPCAPAGDVTLVSPTEITAVTPPGQGTVDVLVGGPNGYSVASDADRFSYAAPTGSGSTGSPGAGLAPASLSLGAAESVSAAGLGSVPIAATVLNTDDQPVAGVPVYLSVYGGALSGSQPVDSSSDGTSTATLTAAAPGLATVTATVYGSPGTPTLVNQVAVNFLPVPIVTGLSVSGGPAAGGTSVTVTGTGFTGAEAVYFGGAAASIVSRSDTAITVLSPPGAGTVDVRVANAAAESGPTAADRFAYPGAGGGSGGTSGPTLSTVSPGAGPVSGGTQVSIAGTGLAGATAVDFGGIPASFQVVSDTEITATTPPGRSGAVDVTVSGPSGTTAVGAGSVFTYLPLPTVTSVSPASGAPAGGTTVLIGGSGFSPSGVTAVYFGAQSASFTVVSSEEISATVPAGQPGSSVDVVVAAACGPAAPACGDSVANPADRYTYLPAPAVTGLGVANGSVAGGTPVTITGSGFTTASQVWFGSEAATFTRISDDEIAATSPAGAAGTVDVTVVSTCATAQTAQATACGTSAVVPQDRFTFGTPPTVTSVSPATGPVAGGNEVTIAGTGFTTAAKVFFGASEAESFTVAADGGSITAVAPPEAAGRVDVTVVTACGTPGTATATSCGTSPVSAADGYTFLPLPSVTAVTPAVGSVSGGEQVVLTGTGLQSVSSVRFGAAAASFTVVSDLEITATVPAGSAGTVDVTVSASCGAGAATSCGASLVNPGDRFTYYPSTAAAVVRTLTPGWNTLSIPFPLANPQLSQILSDGGASLLAAYTFQNGRWRWVNLHDPDILQQPMAGLYVMIGGTQSVTATFDPLGAASGGGSLPPAPSPPSTLSLDVGWNLVGPSAILGSQSYQDFLAGDDPSGVPLLVDPNGAAVPVDAPATVTSGTVQNGYAYWVYASKPGQVLVGEILTGQAPHGH